MPIWGIIVLWGTIELNWIGQTDLGDMYTSIYLYKVISFHG